MTHTRFSLRKHPWLFLLAYMVTWAICLIVTNILLVVVMKLPREAPTTAFWQLLLAHLLSLFVLVPFVLRFREPSQSYAGYLSEIRFSRVRPLLRLVLLGLSCYLLLALSQVAGTLIYRLSHGQPVDLTFIRTGFPFASELPPGSYGWLVSLPSMFEEVAFRGVILALFLRFYGAPKAIVFSALGFGAVHALGLLDGRDPLWVAGQVVWATIMGLFYGYVTLKADSLLPGMMVHYFSNLFIYPLTAYMQDNGGLTAQVLYGITFSLGVVPVPLMSLWARAFTAWWPATPRTRPNVPLAAAAD
jgi:membrane protease YdiL (CAAX protease family)